MAHFYSPKEKGFYNSNVHAVMPEDVFEISDDLYKTLMEGQSLGKAIAYKSRKLQLIDYVDPPKTWDQIRRRRDTKLSNCDWTQIPDNQLSEDDRALWREYRQKLRDVTELFSDPDDVVWPMSPDATSTEE